jgi:flagellar basal-body rod modification protein FlgD
MTNAISQTTNTAAAASAATSATGSNPPAVNEQEFMQLLIAQLQHQDPTQPVQGTEFVTQLAQFSLVEQSANQTQQLTNLNTQVSGLTNDQASQLIGKTVTLNGSSLTFDGSVATPANATLSGPAAQVTATISDSSGNLVRTLNLGPMAAGPITIPWNGLSNTGQTQPAGTYSVNVAATNSSGGYVGVSQNVTGVVANVSFASGSPALTLASGATAPVSNVTSVGSSPTSP